MQTTTMMTLSFGPLPYPLPWRVCDWTPDDARKFGPPHVDLFGEGHRYIGSVGGPPEQDALFSVNSQARRWRERSNRDYRRREQTALDVANLYNRLQPKLGLYALDAVADLRGMTRVEVSALLELAGEVLGR